LFKHQNKHLLLHNTFYTAGFVLWRIRGLCEYSLLSWADMIRLLAWGTFCASTFWTFYYKSSIHHGLLGHVHINLDHCKIKNIASVSTTKLLTVTSTSLQ